VLTWTVILPALAVVTTSLTRPVGVESTRLEEVDERCVPAVPSAGVAAQGLHPACVALQVPARQACRTLDHVLHLPTIAVHMQASRRAEAQQGTRLGAGASLPVLHAMSDTTQALAGTSRSRLSVSCVAMVFHAVTCAW